jgi:hypothetical protein
VEVEVVDKEESSVTLSADCDQESGNSTDPTVPSINPKPSTSLLREPEASSDAEDDLDIWERAEFMEREDCFTGTENMEACECGTVCKGGVAIPRSFDFFSTRSVDSLVLLFTLNLSPAVEKAVIAPVFNLVFCLIPYACEITFICVCERKRCVKIKYQEDGITNI